MLLTYPGCVFAQSVTSTLQGHVEDPAGAPVPGASVRLLNKGTGEIRKAESGENGDYIITNLTPGVYEMRVERIGFKQFQRPELELQVDQTLRVDLRLELGSVAESIEVTAELPLLNTDTASRGEVVASREISEIPLAGRDFNDLTFMVPGVARRSQGGSGSALNINGARSDNTNFLIDGFSNNSMRGGGAQARPPIDALQEYKLQVSGYPAEYGRLAGGVMSMVLKTGTNQLHGTAFEYVRNEVFDARNFFDEKKSELKRNQFGGTAHGPVVIPRLYNGRNRTFFLGSWESYRQTQGATRIGRVPLPLERTGDFSQTIDPATGKIVTLRDPLAAGSCTATQSSACFPGNVIPASRVSPVSAKLQAYYTPENLPGQKNNLRVNRLDTDEWDSFLAKVDHRLGEKDQISGRYMIRFSDQENPFNGSDLGDFGNTNSENLSLGGITWVRTWTPTLILESRVGFSRQNQKQTVEMSSKDWNAEFGLPSPANPESYGFPKITIRDLMTLGNSADMPVRFVTNSYEAGGTLTWVKSSHTIKTGGVLYLFQYFQPALNNYRGTYNFLGRWTNDPYGDFLLGLLNNTSRKASGADPQMTSTAAGFFVQDDWRARRSLTVNIGLRYELAEPRRERKDRLANFVPEYGKIILAARNTTPDMERLINEAGLADRIGYAEDYGLPRSIVVANRNMWAPRLGFAWRPGKGTRTVIRSGGGIFYAGSLTKPVRDDLADVFPYSYNQSFSRNANNPNNLTFATPFPGRGTIDGATNASGMEVWQAPQYLANWNLTIERELSGGTAIELAYVGSKGTHLGRRININQPFRIPELRPPTGGFPRPYTGLNDINYYINGSNSNYHAGMVSWRRRITRGFFFRANYILSKSIDEASQLQGSGDGGYSGAQDARNAKLERGRSDFDNLHAFTMNFTWEVPSKKRLLRAWQLAGSGRLYSGQPFTPKTSNVQLDQGEANRPDRVAHGSLPNPTPDAWYDLSAFPVVPTGSFRFGNSGRNILDGPGFAAINLGLYRRFRIRESHTLQFRWEVFNIMNHPNFELPNQNVNAVNGGVITQATGSRSMQLAVKYLF
jgi:hypothetical protein